MNELMEILTELRPDIDFQEEKSLVTGGVFDSFDIISLVAKIDEEFDVKIKPAHLLPANFDSADAIWALIEKLQDE